MQLINNPFFAIHQVFALSNLGNCRKMWRNVPNLRLEEKAWNLVSDSCQSLAVMVFFRSQLSHVWFPRTQMGLCYFGCVWNPLTYVRKATPTSSEVFELDSSKCKVPLSFLKFPSIYCLALSVCFPYPLTKSTTHEKYQREGNLVYNYSPFKHITYIIYISLHTLYIYAVKLVTGPRLGHFNG